MPVLTVTPNQNPQAPGRLSFGIEGVDTEAFHVDGYGNATVRSIRTREGTNARAGASTLVAGAVTVANTSVTANSRILCTPQNSSGTPGAVYVSARTPGVSFTITSTSSTDTRLVAWNMTEPA